MTVMAEVLAWSLDLPLWQRDALRRIVTQAQPSPNDTAELAELCKAPHGLAGQATSPKPLAAEDLPSAVVGASVALKGVKHLSDVNALAPGQAIAFGPKGLTIVYGDNGAGKSGYARILKRSCRARGTGEPILPNALSELPAGTPAAEITFELDGAEVRHAWRDGQASAEGLSAVSVFDSGSAQVYVTSKTEVAFRPFGLDVIDKLAVACNRVRELLEAERAGHRQAPSWPPVPPGTEAGRLIASLSALTPQAEVERLCALTGEESAEVDRLAAVLAAARAEDPKKRGAEIQMKATRVRKLQQHLEALESQLGPEAAKRFDVARREAAESQAAATAVATGLEGLLPDVGGPEWRRLWDAASDYSTTKAYPGSRFPHVEGGARCVLCEQALDSDSVGRLRRFAKFAGDAAQARAIEAASKLEAGRITVQGLRPGDGLRDVVDEVATASGALGAELSSFLDAAASCREEMLKVLGGGEGDIKPLTERVPSATLTNHAADLERAARDLVAASDPTARRVSEARLAELQARQALAGMKAAVLGDIERRARLNAYETCIKDTNTIGITRKGSELTTGYVTEALAAAFKDELGKLGFTVPELELRPVGGQKGAFYHQVQLKHTTRAELPRIVSEGEARALALAAFLAELRTAAVASPIVFDDPVSSLDHRWRSRVARRLVQEAAVRQVIVFTHELIFLAELRAAAEADDVPIAFQSVRRQGEQAGHVTPEPPWNAQSTKKRLGMLKQEYQRLKQVHSGGTVEEYEDAATLFYGRLRQTWEQGTEEILLNGVVRRFERGVETKRAKRLSDITAADYDALEKGMTKCSTWEGGHDQARAVNEPIPAPAEIEGDLKALEEWVDTIERRRR